jgi:hypothetical protein
MLGIKSFWMFVLPYHIIGGQIISLGLSGFRNALSQRLVVRRVNISF